MFKVILLLFTPFADFHLQLVTCNTEFYSSTTQLEDLLTTEKHFVNGLKEFVRYEQEKIEFVEEYVQNLLKNNREGKINGKKYVENPIDAFSLIKRLSEEWKFIEDFISGYTSKDFVDSLKTSSLELPSDKDMDGAFEGLIRLQETYNLNTSAIANGELNGIKYTHQIVAYDCFSIGWRLHNIKQNYTLALQWFQEAERRHKAGQYPKLSKADILEFMASCYFQLHEIPKAISLIQDLLKDDPDNERLQNNLDHYRSTTITLQNNEPSSLISSNFTKVFVTDYRALCRGDLVFSIGISPQLKCFYYKPSKNKFLQLAAFKVEQVFDSPKILLFHEVMSDEEISILQKLTKPKLFRTQVVNNSNFTRPAKYRVGKMAWFKDEDHVLIRKISNRVGDMTGLTMSSSESLQVLNYGIGGQYEPHYDFFGPEENLQENRIATVLFYLNDVEQGGATVFPRIGVRISTKKGTAALWYNLHSDLTPDERTLHGACPVLVGHKWISNKWIHDITQTFHKPCDLNQPSTTTNTS